MRSILFERILFLAAVLFLLISCNDSDLEIAVPSCIKNKIEIIKNNEISNPPTQIWKWETDDETYYYITSDCCDQYNYLYANNCEIICAPDGGFTGNGDGNCPIFSNEIIKTLIWEDNR
ncbi:hypothetical protein BX611_0345 [Lutibacter oceani]|uniref:DUF6970 domain-containing protein n=1 Tax=Lutibacter oceani TaxID=1853311 RepID=A0A3D9S2H5_9FLAO|nr:hypothetical protein [Lutibacter oceani]REE83065.1 hypothetical protein BX611_0345 [Lutibacter oceani]